MAADGRVGLVFSISANTQMGESLRVASRAWIRSERRLGARSARSKSLASGIRTSPWSFTRMGRATCLKGIRLKTSKIHEDILESTYT